MCQMVATCLRKPQTKCETESLIYMPHVSHFPLYQAFIHRQGNSGRVCNDSQQRKYAEGKRMTQWQSSSWSNHTLFLSLWACINVHRKVQTQQQIDQLFCVIDGGRLNTCNTSWCCLFLSSLCCHVFAIWDQWSSTLINFLLEQHGRSESELDTGLALKIIQNLIWIMVQRD